MNAHTEIQIIVGANGKPAFVVVPYNESQKMKASFVAGSVPNEFVNLSFESGVSPKGNWREHLGLTQAELASRVGIS